jgi:hypothetical protein
MLVALDMRVRTAYGLVLYARSFHKAAKALAGSLQLDGNPVSDVDFSPVVNIYRLALELHLKALVLGNDGISWQQSPIRCRSTRRIRWRGWRSSSPRSSRR